MLLDGLSNLSDLVYVLVYGTNHVRFISTCCNTIKWVHKIRKLYDSKTEMACYDQSFCLNVNDSYYHYMILVDLSDKLRNVYRVDK